MTTHTAIIKNLNKNLPQRLARYNLDYVAVGWDDCTRAKNSSIGKNISDWTYALKDGTKLKYIRHPNFGDRTLTLSTSDICVVVGNEEHNATLKPITLKEFLKNYSKYNPDMPEGIDLSSGEDEHVTLRYISVIVPVGEDGRQEVAPVCYSYNTTNNDNPKNYIASSFHLGTGTRTDNSSSQNVYLVKTNKDNTRENCWFKITSEDKETDEEKRVKASVLGTRSTGVGRDRVMCFQIPRQLDKYERVIVDSESDSESYSESESDSESDGKPIVKAAFRSASSGGTKGIQRGNVSFGSAAGATVINKQIKTNSRDTTQNITLTFAKYYTTDTGIITDNELNEIVSNLNEMYDDKKAKWDGSIVTGESTDGTDSKPLIKLPKLTDNDVASFINKKFNKPDEMSIFPE